MTEELKTCTKCGESKPRTEFSHDRRAKDKLRRSCKTCASKAHKHWRNANPEKYRETTRRWQNINREKHINNATQWRKNNPERQRAVRRNTYATNAAHRATRIFRVRFRDWFRTLGILKDRRVLDAVGCTPEELIQHLESQFLPDMSWDNWATDGWHIDHIVPLASAGDDVDAMMKLWHYTNLRPLWATDNLRKGAKAA